MNPKPSSQNQNPFTDLSSTQRSSPAVAAGVQDRFTRRNYVIRRQVWKVVGAASRIFDENENLLFYSQQKAFKLKEDIRLYTGEDMTQEVLRISARKIIDLSATYDVFDSASGQKVGALRRRGLKSMIQDEWAIFDAQDSEVGAMKEESTALALIRRFIEMAAYFLPQTYLITFRNNPAAIFKQNRNPFVSKIYMDFSPDVSGVLDRRLGIAAAVLLCAIEGKQR